MNILFITKKKRHKYTVLLEKCVNNAIYNNDFDLANEVVDLTYEICGMYGLEYGKLVAHKRAEKLIKELEGGGEE